MQSILGKLVERPAKLDKKLARELKNLSDPTMDPYETVIGKTMCTYDFYEGMYYIECVWCLLSSGLSPKIGVPHHHGYSVSGTI